MKDFKGTTTIVHTDNYPYGFKKTDAQFSIEFDKKKGFREVFRTKDPKKGTWNKEKKSTYSDLMVLYIDENGHCKNFEMSFNGGSYINEAAKFINENFDLFTPDQIEFLYNKIYVYLKLDRFSSIQYMGSTLENINQYYRPLLELIDNVKTSNENHFDKIILDVEGVKSHEIKGYQPFKVVQYGI